MNHKVTILIPTYNRVQNLKNTLSSLKELDNKFFKIFVQDNASTDGTYDYLLSLKNEFNNLSFARNDSNLGAIKNHHLIVNQDHNTPYLMFVCDDDEISLKYFNYIRDIVLSQSYDFIIYCPPKFSNHFTNDLVCCWWGSQSIPGFCFKSSVVKSHYPNDLIFVYPQTTFIINGLTSGKTVHIHHESPIIRPNIENVSESLNTVAGFEIRGSDYCIIKRFNLILNHINKSEKKLIINHMFNEVSVLNYHLINHHKYIRIFHFNLILFTRLFYEDPFLTFKFYFSSLFKAFRAKN